MIRWLPRWLRRILRAQMTDPYKIAAAWRLEGLIVGEGTAIYRNVQFGRNAADPILIGKNCVLTGCTILAHDASTNYLLGLKSSLKKTVVIEDGCFVGFGAIVLMGVTIGQGSIVGAGAIVTRDVPPRSVAVGNPARIVCTVDELVHKRQQLIADGFYT